MMPALAGYLHYADDRRAGLAGRLLRRRRAGTGYDFHVHDRVPAWPAARPHATRSAPRASIDYDDSRPAPPVRRPTRSGSTCSAVVRLPRPAATRGHRRQRQHDAARHSRRPGSSPRSYVRGKNGDGRRRRCPSVRMEYDLLRVRRARPAGLGPQRSSSGAPRHRDRRRRPSGATTRSSRSSTPTASAACCRPGRRPRTPCSATPSSAAACSRPTSPRPVPAAGRPRAVRRTPPNVDRQRLAGLRQQGPGRREVRAVLRHRLGLRRPGRRPARPEGERCSTTRAARRCARSTPTAPSSRSSSAIPADLADPDVFAPTPWEAYTYDANDNAGRTHGAGRRWPTATTGTPRPASRSTRSAAPSSPSPATAPTRTATGSPPAPTLRHPGQPGRSSPTRSAASRSATSTTSPSAAGGSTASTPAAATASWTCVGNAVESRDSKGALTLAAYDVLHRPIRVWARDGATGPVTLRQRIEYGDGAIPHQPAAERDAARAHNLLGRPVATTTKPGSPPSPPSTSRATCSTSPAGSSPTRRSSPSSTRRRPTAGRSHRSRSTGSRRRQQTLADRAAELLEADGLPDDRELRRAEPHQAHPAIPPGRRRPAARAAPGLQPRRRRWSRSSLDDTLYVERIAYDAKGQRALIAYGNGVMTRYAYDPRHVPPEAPAQRALHQPDGLTYRPAARRCRTSATTTTWLGNILAIRDRTPGSGIPNNPERARCRRPRVWGNCWSAATRSTAASSYDPIYRLLSATGRECDRPTGRPPWEDQPRGTDLTAHRAYTERYRYDPMGNLLRLEHTADAAGVHPRVHRRDGQQPPAPHEIGGRRLRLHLRRQRQPCRRRRPRATSSGTTPTR